MYTTVAWIHLVTAVLLVGYALFWALLAFALSERTAGVEAIRLLDLVRQSRWPPFLLPERGRLPLVALGWLFLLALALTGILLAAVRTGTTPSAAGVGLPALLIAKLALVSVLVVGQAVFTFRPVVWICYVNGLVVLGIVALSALLPG